MFVADSWQFEFPHFHFGKAWRKSLYGDVSVAPVEVPHGQHAAHSHPSLDLNVGLTWDGAASFDAPDWKLNVVPAWSLSAPKLHKGEGLHLLRGDDGEIGISFDKNSSRHFFLLTKAPASPKFSLHLKVRALIIIGQNITNNTDR